MEQKHWKLFIYLSMVIILSQGCVSKKKYDSLIGQQEAIGMELNEKVKQIELQEERIKQAIYLNEQMRQEQSLLQEENEMLKLSLSRLELELNQLTEVGSNDFWASSAIMPTLPGGFEDITLSTGFLSKVTYVHEMEDVLEEILDKQEFIKNRFFPMTGGFGLMTNIERIYDDGTSMPEPERWNHEVRFSEEERGWWLSFSNARKGRFRTFVFLITDGVYKEEKQKLPFDEAKKWLASGFNRLPAVTESERIKISPNHYCDVLVYEFEKSDSCPEGCPKSSGYSAKYHLQKAKLWEALNKK